MSGVSPRRFLSLPRWLRITSNEFKDDKVVIQGQVRKKNACCPLCGKQSSRAPHSSYRRRLSDLEVSGKQLDLNIRVRKYFCTNLSCEKKIFSEDISELATRHSRKTNRVTRRIEDTAMEVSSTKASYLLGKQSIVVSPSTCVRLLLKKEIPDPPPPKAVGIDDFATKRGHTYGSVIVDHESGRPIDVLPSRGSEDVEKWFEAHPCVLRATRDRGREFIQGISAANPSICQISDRFHLMQNISDKSMDYLLPLLGEYKLKNPDIVSPLQSESKEEMRQLLEDRIADMNGENNRRHSENWKNVYSLNTQGYTILQIANTLEMKSVDVRRYIYSHRGKYTTREQRKLQNNINHIMDAIIRYGTWNPQAVYGKLRLAIRKKLKKEWVEKLLGPFHKKKERLKKKPNKPRITHREEKKELFNMLFQKDYACKTDYIAAFFDSKEHDFSILTYLCRQFRKLIQAGNRDFSLDNWIRMAQTSGFEFLEAFANGIRKEFKSVNANKYTPLSNGILEGTVNRIKCIKRQMYGRASFRLLRVKILGARYG